MDENPVIQTTLVHGLVNRERRSSNHMFIVDIGNDADDAAHLRLIAGERRTYPPHLPVDRISVWEESLSDALTDNRDLLAGAAITIIEFAAGQERNAEH